MLTAVLLLSVCAIAVPETLSGATTTTRPGRNVRIPPDSPPNPLQLYPRRPGARYDDAEARPTESVTLLGARLRVVSSNIEPQSTLPAGSVPAKVKPFEDVGLVDQYAPSVTTTTGDLLHVVIQVTPAPLADTPTCVATVDETGTVLVPYQTPSQPVPTVTAVGGSPGPTSVDLSFPIGAERGMVYITCRAGEDTALGSKVASLVDQTRAVWGLDVA